MFVQDNTLTSALDYLKNRLENQYSPSEIRQIQRLFFEQEFQLSPSELILQKDRRFTESELLKIRAFVHRLRDNEPLQYILGKTEFCGLTFKTDSRALIPRPETEELVYQIQNRLQYMENPAILDLCTGSGCIAVSLKKLLPSSKTFGADISQKALELALENANELKAEVQFFNHDALQLNYQDAIIGMQWDCIVSNPPYIPHKDRDEMHERVLKHEPEIALFVPDTDPLIFYNSITQYAATNLKTTGILAFEIHENLSKEVKSILQENGFKNLEILKDMQEKSRMVIAQK